MMDTERVNHAMWDATDRLRVAPDFTDRVVRGGRRRVRRARVRGIAIAVTVVMAGGGATVAWRDAAGTAFVADHRLSQPTAGDLAGDAGLIQRVVHAWSDGIRHSERGDDTVSALRGEPHVYWAGTTEAGPAAVVVQAGTRRGQVAAAGLVATDPVSKEFRLVGEESPADGVSYVYAFGPRDGTLLAVDAGMPLYISMAPVTAPNGKVSREWRRMSTVDGVVLAEVPAGGDVDDVRVLARPAPPAPDGSDSTGLYPVRTASDYVRLAEARRAGEGGVVTIGTACDGTLPWENMSDRGQIRVAQPWFAGDGDPLFRAARDAGFLDPLLSNHRTGWWDAVGSLPDGRVVLVGEVCLESDPPLLFAVVLNAAGKADAVIPGGTADRDAPVPVRVRLPDGHGWSVAAYGSALSYRTPGGGAWVEAGTDAALLPDTATEVRVVTTGGAVRSQRL